MNPFDEDDKNRRRRRRDPFDIFGFDDDFIGDLLDDERFMEDIKRMTEEMMKMFSNARPDRPIVHGFKIHFGPDGKPRIEDFGNKPVKSPDGESIISEEREPLTDIIEGDDDVAVTVEIPGVEKNDIDLDAEKIPAEVKLKVAGKDIIFIHHSFWVPRDAKQIINTVSKNYFLPQRPVKQKYRRRGFLTTK